MAVSLADRTALITGATHGPGRGIAGYFADDGVRIVFSGPDAATGAEFEGKVRANRAESSSITGQFLVIDGCRTPQEIQ